ncbi:glycogen synthase GlgA [Azoarcus indigens]|uniref:Glycogen synthase n=1 Tax=Azoarcus indigens TaxID=29545 RepID=A0A4R6ECI1_9RHOO|nr:glycogen synthase GlgA [Azoarcus indigens]NMG64268.1 glycogen synthase GlgA [Azoarcus indigens]TDN55861.1 starch synthase [Azoarcus indigens]
MSKNSTLQILFVTPECAPWAKTGGLGEVSAGLPAALLGLGVDVRVLMPAYPSVLEQAKGLRRVAAFEAEAGLPAAGLLRGKLPSGVPALLLDCPALYTRSGGPYQDAHGLDYADNVLRFGLLSRVAAQLASAGSPLGWRPDVLHCNDWPAALAPAYLKLGLEGPAPSVVAIHNLAFQGIFPLDNGPALGLPDSALGVEGVEYWGHMSFLKAGLYYADRIVTVSPTYAGEILGEHLGCGMQGLLQTRSARVSGILNGIDTDIWNPATDPHLVSNYDADSLAAKADNKRALQAQMGLEQDDAVLLLGIVSRLTDQKGVDLVLEALPELLGRPVQLAVLGSGEEKLENALLAAEKEWPGKVAVKIGFDEALAHRIEAGADAFLMPSRFEPCGLNQMYSQRYGTPPIVRATGGLADSVGDYTPAGLETGEATGFVFDDPTAQALIATVDRVAAVRAEPAAWVQLQRNGMSCDFGWSTSARGYLRLYRSMLEEQDEGKDGRGSQAKGRGKGAKEGEGGAGAGRGRKKMPETVAVAVVETLAGPRRAGAGVRRGGRKAAELAEQEAGNVAPPPKVETEPRGGGGGKGGAG